MTCLASPQVKKTPLACHLRDNNACLFFLRRFRQVIMTANSDSSYLFSLLFLYFSFVLLFGVLSHAFSPYRIAPRTLKRSWENNVASKDSFGFFGRSFGQGKSPVERAAVGIFPQPKQKRLIPFRPAYLSSYKDKADISLKQKMV